MTGETEIIGRIAAFLRLLRDNGFPVATPELGDALQLADHGGLGDPARTRRSWRALLCTRREEWDRFDELFDAYWLRRGMKRSARVTGPSRGGSGARTISQLGGGDWMAEWLGGGGDTANGTGEARRGGASGADNLADVDLRRLDDEDEIARAEDLAERLARRMRHNLSRRRRVAARGRRLDLRKIIHRSIPTGGEPVRLAFREKPERPLRLVLILDASGSMSAYGAFFLRFIRGVLGAFSSAEAFAFHTRLVHLSDAMRERDPVKSFERLSLMTAGWSGGTKIGDSLATFNRHHAARALNRRTVVIILSDGYDTSPPELLARELETIRHRARKVVWLNPLLAAKDYEPTARGMAAALPYIDLFRPAHSLQSLAGLESDLVQL